MLVTQTESVKDIPLLPYDVCRCAVTNFVLEVFVRESDSASLDKLDVIYVGELVVMAVRSACHQMIGEEVRSVNRKSRCEINGIQKRTVAL